MAICDLRSSNCSWSISTPRADCAFANSYQSFRHVVNLYSSPQICSILVEAALVTKGDS